MKHPVLPPSKLPHVGTTIFTTMSALAAEHGALNVAQGFPDLETPVPLREAVKKAIDDGVNQYAPMAGDVGLREWISNWYRESNGAEYDVATEITIGAGASSVIFAALQAFVNEGDEVIIVDPSYDLYAPAVHLAKGVIKRAEGIESIEKHLTEKTRAVVINSPHNPTGDCFSEEDLKGLELILIGTNVLLFSDEVYRPMAHDSRPNLSASHLPNLRNRTLIFGSFGKLFHATGWKIGWVVAPKAITRELRKVHQYDVFSTGAPIQRGLAKYLSTEHSREHLRNVGPIYERKRNRLLEGLKGTAFRFTPAEGGYFQVLDYSQLKTLGDKPDIDVARELTINHGLATIPLSPFRESQSESALSERRLRICFAKGDDTIDATIEKLVAIDKFYKDV